MRSSVGRGRAPRRAGTPIPRSKFDVSFEPGLAFDHDGAGRHLEPASARSTSTLNDGAPRGANRRSCPRRTDRRGRRRAMRAGPACRATTTSCAGAARIDLRLALHLAHLTEHLGGELVHGGVAADCGGCELGGLGPGGAGGWSLPATTTTLPRSRTEERRQQPQQRREREAQRGARRGRRRDRTSSVSLPYARPFTSST